MLDRHCGEPGDAYDPVATVYFAQVWDQHIAAPALVHVNVLLSQ